MSKILIIQTAFVGDVILVTPLLRAISQELPDSLVTLMVIPQTKNIVENNPFIKNLYVFDKNGKQKNLGGFNHWVKKIKKEGFDTALIPHRSYRSALIARLAKIPIRIGFDRSPARWFYTHVIKYRNTDHEVVRNLNLLMPFGVNNVGLIRPELFSDDHDIVYVENLLSSAHLSSTDNLIAIAPGSVWYTKRWPETYYANLADLFLRENFGVCLIGGKEDRSTGAIIAKRTKNKVHNFIGKLTLRQSAELLKMCKILIGNDSAPSHLGSGANIPTITIFGSTVPDFGFSPISEKHKVIRKDISCQPCTNHGRRRCPVRTLACLKDILPQNVFDSALELLNS